MNFKSIKAMLRNSLLWSMFIIAGIFFWSVQDTIALKVNHSNERERSDKKTKISILKEWQEQQASIVPGILIIKFKPSVQINKATGSSNQMLLNAQLQRAGVQKLTPVVSLMKKWSSVNSIYHLDQMYYAELQSGKNEYESAEMLTKDISVEYAEPKRMHYLSYIPNDPLYAGATPGPQNIYFGIMKVTQGWDIVRADSNAGGMIPKNNRVIIAVVDGGTMWEHQDLTGNLWINSLEDINVNGVFDNFASTSGGDLDGIDQDGNGYIDDVIGWNFPFNNSNPRGGAATPLSADHGTACGSYFGAVTKNGIGMAGTAFNPRVMPVCGGSATTDNAIAYGYEGILYAAENGANVISCSWGSVGGYSNFEQDVINAVTDVGTLVLGAAGNGGSDGVGDQNDLTPHYPSNYNRILAVGATRIRL
jgi:serine protease